MSTRLYKYLLVLMSASLVRKQQVARQAAQHVARDRDKKNGHSVRVGDVPVDWTTQASVDIPQPMIDSLLSIPLLERVFTGLRA